MRCRLQAEPDVLGDGQVREERVVLEDHADPALLGRYPRSGARDSAAVDLDGASARLLEPGDEAQERGLPTAGGPEDGDDLTAVDAE